MAGIPQRLDLDDALALDVLEHRLRRALPSGGTAAFKRHAAYRRGERRDASPADSATQRNSLVGRIRDVLGRKRHEVGVARNRPERIGRGCPPLDLVDVRSVLSGGVVHLAVVPVVEDGAGEELARLPVHALLPRPSAGSEERVEVESVLAVEVHAAPRLVYDGEYSVHRLEDAHRAVEVLPPGLREREASDAPPHRVASLPVRIVARDLVLRAEVGGLAHSAARLYVHASADVSVELHPVAAEIAVELVASVESAGVPLRARGVYGIFEDLLPFREHRVPVPVERRRRAAPDVAPALRHADVGEVREERLAVVREHASRTRQRHRGLLSVFDFSVSVCVVPERHVVLLVEDRRAAHDAASVVSHAVDPAVVFAREVEPPSAPDGDGLLEVAAHSARHVREHGVRAPPAAPVVEHEAREHVPHGRDVEMGRILRIDHVAGIAAHLVRRVFADVPAGPRVPLGRAVRSVELHDEQPVAALRVAPRGEGARTHHRLRVVRSGRLGVGAAELQLDLPLRGHAVDVVSRRIGEEEAPLAVDRKIARLETADVEDLSDIASGESVGESECADGPVRAVRTVKHVKRVAMHRERARTAHAHGSAVRSIGTGKDGDAVDELAVADDCALVSARSLLA